ncbi:MAG: ROK family protein [Pyrinomonadaceae bacterium]|nr:ROK family protein [Pyrinomonadaceae bacterium]
MKFASVEDDKFGFEEVVLDFNKGLREQIIAFIRHLQEKFGRFEKLGVAVSGVVSKHKDRVLYSRHFAELTATDFIKNVESECSVKIYLENDANAAAWAEYKLGAGRGSESIFYVLLGKGVGGAFILDGGIWRGADGFAGEIGQIPVDTEENLRLEEVASSDGIVRRIKNRIHQDHTSSLARISEELITITDIIREANNKDEFTQMMLERTGNFIGIAVANALNLLNVEKVILGGSIMQAGEPILKGVKQSAEIYTFKPGFNSAKIISGELGDRASAIGAALLAS